MPYPPPWRVVPFKSLAQSTKILALCGILVTLSTSSCNKSDPGPELQCEWPKDYKFEETIIAQKGKTRFIPFSGTNGVFVIDVKGDTYTGTIAPCNLSAEAQIDSLDVTVSGHKLWFPYIGNADILGIPFEITELQINK